ncbi:ATP-binding protein [Streptomyces caniscabiei]|uniref:ATP-binding protein n=1 Tax=Streptomyces caniscabiei TaxID=2746961 RepID=UPI0023DB2174|nr:ATP-binding protein [Streptomyces caniscabiei]MDX3511357.1 ATP-binding protein [Streptomyces caniscabiei]MDX3718462.1 ATP-binding protein [Streptomyces caniscabiei]WEO22133.1 ATP-binding protein [Streptomyces caniscabiei]
MAHRHPGRPTHTLGTTLPDPWTLDDFDFDFAAQPGVDEKPIRDLATRRSLDDASNALFVGPHGVGKTMLATALARGAAEAGNGVYFTTAADLAARDSVASGAPPSVVRQGGTTTTLSSASTTPLRSEVCEARRPQHRDERGLIDSRSIRTADTDTLGRPPGCGELVRRAAG